MGTYEPLWMVPGTESCGPFNYEEREDIESLDLDNCIICGSSEDVVIRRDLQLCTKCSGIEFLSDGYG